jgi:hypothetical protein
LRNPEHFEPLKVGRFSVVRVYYQFRGQEGNEKLFVVLRHGKESNVDACWCIKATSKTDYYYDVRPELIPGVVIYEAGELRFFPMKTVIDPYNFLAIHHSYLASQSAKNRYQIEGTMPDDFHGKLTIAIQHNFRLEPKNKTHLLSCISRD